MPAGGMLSGLSCIILPPAPIFVCRLIIGEVANWSTPSTMALVLGEDVRS